MGAASGGLTELLRCKGNCILVKSLSKEGGVVLCPGSQRLVVEAVILPAVAKPEASQPLPREVGRHIRPAGVTGIRLAPGPGGGKQLRHSVVVQGTQGGVVQQLPHNHKNVLETNAKETYTAESPLHPSHPIPGEWAMSGIGTEQGGREGGMEGWRKHEGRDGGSMEGGREGWREGWREHGGSREIGREGESSKGGVKEGWREQGDREGGREHGGRGEGGMEGGREHGGRGEGGMEGAWREWREHGGSMEGGGRKEGEVRRDGWGEGWRGEEGNEGEGMSDV